MNDSGRNTFVIPCVAAVALLACAGCQQNNLRALLATPDLECAGADGGSAVTCTTLDFGDVSVGDEKQLVVDLADLGNATLVVTDSGWTPDSDLQFSDHFPVTSVNGDGRAPFTITFSPVLLGRVTGTFYVKTTNSTKSEVEIDVTGTGVGAAQAAISPASLAFGNVLQNTTASRTVTLSNMGNVDLSILSAGIQGASAFGVAMPAVSTLTAMSTLSLTVTYSPTGPEMDSGTLVVKATTPAAPSGTAPQSVSVSLTGESEPVIAVTPMAINFGGVAQETTSPPVFVTVQNIGEADLQITSAALTPGSSMYFKVLSPAVPPLTLHPGDTDLVTVFYDTVGKTTMTADTGELDFDSSDPMTPLVRIPITGACPTCTNVVDSGCNSTYPHRLWPTGADIPSCSEGGPILNTTGPGAENWFDYAGCGDRRDFTTTPGTAIQISTWGDGCGCPGCVLWHIDYTLQENTGAGFQTEETVQAQDAIQCPSTGGTTNTTFFTPMTADVRMTAQFDTTGIGFYYVVCSQ
jgi:hypothetical protein